MSTLIFLIKPSRDHLHGDSGMKFFSHFINMQLLLSYWDHGYNTPLNCTVDGKHNGTMMHTQDMSMETEDTSKFVLTQSFRMV